MNLASQHPTPRTNLIPISSLLAIPTPPMNCFYLFLRNNSHPILTPKNKQSPMQKASPFPHQPPAQISNLNPQP